MQLIAVISNFRIQDVLDILFLTVFAYHLYLWFKGTKAFKALVGLMALGLVFTVARTWGLFLTTWVFQILWQVLVILLIILFQKEIREVLERVNPLRAVGLHRRSDPGGWIRHFSEAVFKMGAQQIGALVIVQRADRVEPLITAGHALEGDPTPELVWSIFQKASPLHDGAVLIRDGKITQVSCYLPLSSVDGLPQAWGTRHRAAAGLTERCDAWVVVVSEERGDVSLARGGEMVRVQDPETLSRLIQEAHDPIKPLKRSRSERIRALVQDNWPAKAISFGLVIALWIMLAGQQDFEVVLRVPLDLKNVPKNMRIIKPVRQEVQIRVSGLRRDASMLDEDNVRAAVDLSTAKFGRRRFSIGRDNIRLPNDRVQVVNIEPSQVVFQFQTTEEP